MASKQLQRSDIFSVWLLLWSMKIWLSKSSIQVVWNKLKKDHQKKIGRLKGIRKRKVKRDLITSLLIM